MPSRWQSEYTCSRCARYVSGASHARVTSWSHITREQVVLFMLCERCLGDMRDWLYSATFDELWSYTVRS